MHSCARPSSLAFQIFHGIALYLSRRRKLPPISKFNERANFRHIFFLCFHFNFTWTFTMMCFCRVIHFFVECLGTALHFLKKIIPLLLSEKYFPVCNFAWCLWETSSHINSRLPFLTYHASYSSSPMSASCWQFYHTFSRFSTQYIENRRQRRSLKKRGFTGGGLLFNIASG